MRALTVYECQYCKKLYRTPNRHQCKFRPELKNCFTCKNGGDWNREVEGDGYSSDVYANCHYSEEWGLRLIKDVGYNMQCEGWQAKEAGA